ncbi:MAG: hypothetical protein V4725_08135 [Bacteroidota bacterium]
MKALFIISILFAIASSSFAQLSPKNIKDTARTPIEGTSFKEGKVFLAAGYQVALSRDRKIATIMKLPARIVKGSYACTSPNGKCSITTTGATILCVGDAACQMVSTTRKIDFAAHDASAEDLEFTKWKVLVIPQ